MAHDTREKIIEAGKALFSAKGYAAVTTKKISKAAGISEVTLYRHFESKRCLFNTIVKENMMNFGITSYLENEVTYDVQKDLSKIAELFVTTYEKNAALIRMVMKDPFLKSEAKSHSRSIENSDMKILQKYFEELAARKIIKDDPEKLMKLFLSNIHGFVMHNLIFKDNGKADSKKEYEYFNWLINKIIEIILM